MKQRAGIYLSMSVFLFLMVFVTTMWINGTAAMLEERTFDIEAGVVALLSQQIDHNYEEATLQAQAVIARSNLCRLMFREQKLFEFLYEQKDFLTDILFLWKTPWKRLEKAVKQTEGQVLMHEQELKLVPYHEVSSGKTRSGKEVFRDSEYTYLKSVNSEMDKDSSEFLNSTYISVQQLPNTINIEEKDSAGYVRSLMGDGKMLEGEGFRKGMGLSSSNFIMQKIGDEIRFLCKGKGHGLGFSQYGANELAKQKKTYQELLSYYFPEMEIVHISGISLKNE